MLAEKGFSQIILIAAIIILGLMGFFILNRPNYTAPVVQEKQAQPPQTNDNNSSRQVQGGHSNKESFYNKDGIALQHYWPGEPSFSAEETEILLFNELSPSSFEQGFEFLSNDNKSSANLEVKSFDLTYTVEGKTYPHKSGTWEKFSTIEGWERIEYINISPQNYKGEPLTLKPNQKGKLHWHINFGPNPLDGKQIVKLKLILLRDGQTINIDEEFNRDSGTVFSKENH